MCLLLLLTLLPPPLGYLLFLFFFQKKTGEVKFGFQRQNQSSFSLPGNLLPLHWHRRPGLPTLPVDTPGDQGQEPGDRSTNNFSKHKSTTVFSSRRRWRRSLSGPGWRSCRSSAGRNGRRRRKRLRSKEKIEFQTLDNECFFI